MIYEDFHLRIAPDGEEGFQVRARFGEQRASTPLTLPPDLDLLGSLPNQAPAGLVRDLKSMASSSKQVASPEEVGSQLLQGLLGSEIRRLLDTAYGACGDDPNRALRLRLHFPTGERRVWRLQSLPWELLYHAEDHRFLALDRRMPVVRSMDTNRPLRVLPPSRPLEVLIAMANPPRSSLLNLQSERERIEESLSRIDQTRIVVLEEATLRELRLRLRSEPFQIVHFMGHGVGFDEESGEGALFLDSSEGKAVPLSATGLAELFEGLQAPRLVVLNACETANASESLDPVRSVAASIVVAGLPAVLAQRAAIQDDVALILSEELYRRLALDDPIEAAVTEARLALRLERRGTSDWAIPALFVRPDSSGTTLLPEEAEPTKESAVPAPPTEPTPALPEFVQNVKAKRVGKQRNIQGETVYYQEES